VATTGTVQNVKDAYDDPRFNRDNDAETGRRMRSILCIPIFDENEDVRGVTEMKN
jgi:GAF domain-containing protein